VTARLPVILIPAYNPDESLLAVVNALVQHAQAYQSLLIVDDGSDMNSSQAIFAALEGMTEVTLLRHKRNRGKGAALKTGFQWVLDHAPETTGVITADADGQHLPEDIIRVLEAFVQQPEALWLGCRDFSEQDTPWRSKVGNFFARYTFQLLQGIKIPDTQTGLRGVPREMLDALVKMPSDHYELELDMLMLAKREGIHFSSLPITTVYEDDNACSHFKPVQDSALVYKKFLKFSGVGVASAALDYSLFALVYGLTGEILAAIVTARVLSGIFNFTLNRQWVFGRGKSVGVDATKYTLLAAVLVGLNYLLTKGAYLIGISPFIGKPLSELIVFVLSYRFQKRLVFNKTD